MYLGLEAERLIMEILIKNGTNVRWSTPEEDMFLKVDIWFPIDGGWVGVQLSIDKDKIFKEKRTIILNRGIVPMWINWDKLQTAIEEKNENGIAKEFCTRVKKIFYAFPNLKRFSKPEWDLRLQIN